jgi:MFS family permease
MRSKPLILVALLLTFGSLSDRLGRKGMLLAALGHPVLGRALHHASTHALLRGLTIGCIVAGAVAAAGALLAVLFPPAAPD